MTNLPPANVCPQCHEKNMIDQIGQGFGLSKEASTRKRMNDRLSVAVGMIVSDLPEITPEEASFLKRLLIHYTSTNRVPVNSSTVDHVYGLHRNSPKL